MGQLANLPALNVEPGRLVVLADVGVVLRPLALCPLDRHLPSLGRVEDDIDRLPPPGPELVLALLVAAYKRVPLLGAAAPP